MANATFAWKSQMGDSNKRMQLGTSNSFATKGALYKGTNHMGRSIAYEPQRLYNFELQIIGLDQLFTANNPGTGNYSNYSSGEFIHFGSAAERILVACSSFNIPETSVGTIEIPHYNNTTKYAGKVSFGSATLVIEQFLGSFTEQIITTWLRCVYDMRTQNIGFKNDYAKDMFLIQYDSKGGTPRVWKLENAWPGTLPGAAWDYASDGRRQLSITINCDRCIPDYGIDTRTFGAIEDNALNSITRSAASAQGNPNLEYTNAPVSGWSYDPMQKKYVNPITGIGIPAFSDNR